MDANDSDMLNGEARRQLECDGEPSVPRVPLEPCSLESKELSRRLPDITGLSVDRRRPF